MKGLHAVVLDDDESFLKFVAFTLLEEGFQVTMLTRGNELMKHISLNRPDLVFLDRLLPDTTGFELCEKIKLRYSDILIVMFSTLGETQDVIDGLELGADEYLPKPFAPQLLKARISSLLRRSKHGASENSRLVFKDLSIDKTSHKVSLEGHELTLTKTEFQLLKVLMERCDELVTYEDIMTSILGYNACVEEMHQNIFFHVASLRKKLKHYRGHLATVRGFGYRLCSDIAETAKN